MPSAPGPSAPAWMVRVTEAAGALLLALRIQLLWIALTLLGLGLLGLAPATVAAGDAFLASRHGAKVRVRSVMWDSWRRELVPANLRMLPLLIVQAGSLAMMWLQMGAVSPDSAGPVVLAGLAVLCAAWSTVSLGALAVVPRVREQELLVSWRLALLLPAALPVRFLGLVLLLVLWTALCSAAWPIGLLLGASGAVRITEVLLSGPMSRMLEDLAASARAAARMHR